MISKGQLKLIHTAKDRLGLTYEEYKEILALYGGARSSKELSPEGFFEVMEHFRELGFTLRGADVFVHPEPGQKQAGPAGDNVIEMVTPRQRAFIRKMERALGWDEDPERLSHFIEKRLGMKKVRTKKEAMKLIEAMKAMVRRAKEKEKG
jgi:DNA-binding transcriptional MerR regulator